MGMTKSADTKVDQAMNTQSAPTNNFLLNGDYIPLEIYKYFNIDPSTASAKDEREIRGLLEIAGRKNKTLPDALGSFRKAEVKLGVPAMGETRLVKLYNYMTVKNKIQVQNRENNKLLKAFEG